MIKLVSVYDNIFDVKSFSAKDIDHILTIIKYGYPQLISQITAIRNMASHQEQNIAKKELPLFCCNGTFHHRSNSSLLQYSSFIAIDFDGFSSNTELLAYKEHLKTYSFVYAVFVSPSGNGLKAIIQHTSTNPQHHYNLFVQLHRVFGLGNTNFDSVVSDISRGTYFSYDPDLWINPCCKPFEFVYDLGIGDKKEKAVTNGKSVTETVSYHYETTEEDLTSWHIGFESQEAYGAWLKTVAERCTYECADYDVEKNTITLSTCRGATGGPGRFIVHLQKK